MNESATSRAWEVVENEKERNRLLARASVIAWSIALGVAAIYAILSVVEIVAIAEFNVGNGVEIIDVIPLVRPMVGALGAMILVIAVLGSAALYLRMRTVSLNELQLRLAALEDVLIGRTQV